MKQYLGLLSDIMTNGEDVQTGTTLEDGSKPMARFLFAQQFRHDLVAGFPAVTTKPLRFATMAKELMWFLRGETNIATLGAKIWNQWADENGSCGPIYGAQWRRWPYVPFGESGPLMEWDQIGKTLEAVRAVAANPFNRARRRIVVSAWNPPQIEHMGLAPCHTAFQLLPTNGRLDIHCFWRSIDMLLGFPFNVTSYSLLTHLLCELSGLKPGTLVASITDAHIYHNQFDAVVEQLRREPKPLPRLAISPSFKALAPDLTVEQCRLINTSLFSLEGYESHPPLENAPEIAV